MTIYRMIENGVIPSLRVNTGKVGNAEHGRGSEFRFDPQLIADWMEGQTYHPPQDRVNEWFRNRGLDLELTPDQTTKLWAWLNNDLKLM